MRRINAVHQLLPNFSPRDAIGNEVVLMRQVIRSMGFESEIFCENSQVADPPAKSIEDFFSDYARHDVAVIYHFSIDSHIPMRLAPLNIVRGMRYHNITPPEFFVRPGEVCAHESCSRGRQQIPLVSLISDFTLAASHYNAEEIRPFSSHKPEILPLLRDYSQLKQYANHGKSSRSNRILFVGRIAPNKCQHDLVCLLHLARISFAPDLQLTLVGSFFSESYQKDLETLALGLGLSMGSKEEENPDILVLSHINEHELAELYSDSLVFVSMSEHEGFGVPFVEAMHFGLPIMAHAAAAIPETIGDAGLLFDKAEITDSLNVLKTLMTDRSLRRQLQDKMHSRAEELGLERTSAIFKEWLKKEIQVL